MRFTVDGKGAFAATGGRPFDPALPALVCLHGAGMDHTVWTLQTRYFAHHGWSVLALDLPGHGGSEGPALTKVEAIGAWTLSALAAAGGRRAAFAGHSMGALAALEAAAAAGDDAIALLMLGVVPTMAVHPDLQAAADAGDHRAVETMIGWGFGRAMQIGGNRAPGSWVSGAGLRVLERGLAGALGNDLRASSGYAGALATATRVRCPALILAGDDDRMTPARQVRPLAEALADANVVTLARTGHMMPIERPDETLDAMRDFLAGAGR